MNSIGSIFNLPLVNSERFKPYTTSSPRDRRLQTILYKTEWEDYMKKQHLKQVNPALSYMSFNEKMERLKKLIGDASTGFQTKKQAEQPIKHLSNKSELLSMNNSVLVDKVRSVISPLLFFDRPVSDDLRNSDGGRESQKKEVLAMPQNSATSARLPNATETSRVDVHRVWRHNKYLDEKEQRILEVKRLEAELADRKLSKHNRKISEEETRRLRLGIEGLVLERRKPLRDEFPELPHFAEKLLKIIWDKNAPQNEVFSSAFGAEITRKDLLTLSGSEWLNDEVINFFVNLIVLRNQKDSSLPKIYGFNTFFFQKLSQSGFSGVKRWTKKVDIFAHQLLLVPIHLGNHWCMVIVDFKECKIDYFDSLLGDNHHCIEILRDYLMEESNDKKKCPFDTSDWVFTCRKDIPHQMNMCDCGMFACMFAEYSSRRAPITFSQRDIPYFRKRIAYEIYKKELF